MSSNFLNDENKGDIIIYQSESGETKIDVRFQDETVWLTQAQMEELFQSSHANVVEHIKNIYSEGELDESSTCRKFRQVRREGNRNVERERLYYNLDMIISGLSHQVLHCNAVPPLGYRALEGVHDQGLRHGR